MYTEVHVINFSNQFERLCYPQSYDNVDVEKETPETKVVIDSIDSMLIICLPAHSLSPQRDILAVSLDHCCSKIFISPKFHDQQNSLAVDESTARRFC